MNERIREIYRRSFTDGYFGPSFDAETFARLIVEHCLATLEEERVGYASPGSYESFDYYERMAAKEQAIEDAMDLIRSRFGVNK